MTGVSLTKTQLIISIKDSLRQKHLKSTSTLLDFLCSNSFVQTNKHLDCRVPYLIRTLSWAQHLVKLASVSSVWQKRGSVADKTACRIIVRSSTFNSGSKALS